MATKKNTEKNVKTAQTTTATPEPATPAKVKKPKAPKVEIPLTEAQKAAKEALEKANKEAKEELQKNAKEKIEIADKAIEEAKSALKKAQLERKALNKALGIKGQFGGKKVNTLVYVKDFPENKGAPQARAILEIIKAGGKDGISREKVVETMKTAITTSMDRSRLLSFYTSKLIEAGTVAVS